MHKRLLSLLSLSIVVVLCLCTVTGAERVKPVALRCEYLANPLGIDEPNPRLSWKLESSQRGQRQTAYHILVASSREQLAQDQGNLWDSGKITSGQSSHVPYQGETLISRTRCFWKLKIWDNDGVASTWSQPAHWSMGLLKAGDWKAKWIGLDSSASHPQPNVPSLEPASWIWYPVRSPATHAPDGSYFFRRSFQLPRGREVKSATVRFTVDNTYTLWLNGQKILHGTDWNTCETADVGSHLLAGTNTLAVEATNLGNGPNPAGLIGVLSVTFEAGPHLTVLTDAGWKVSDKQETDWQSHQHTDVAWKSAKVVGTYGVDPWGHVSRNHGEPNSGVPRTPPARYFRSDFSLEKHIEGATAYICGLGYNMLFINGNRVGNRQLDPILRDYSKQSPYSVYDVTEQITTGDNTMGVILGNGRFYPSSLDVPTPTRTYGLPRVLLQVEITHTDGSSRTIISDDGWRTTDSGPIRNHSDYHGETYDARMDMPGWSQVGFDDSSWQPATVVDAPKGQLTSSSLVQPMRITGTIKPVKLTEPEPGVWVFDMGQNMVGWCRLAVEAPAGTPIKMRFAENIHPGGMIDGANLRAAQCTDTYICSGKGLETYRPSFTYHGFRYVEVTGLTDAPTRESLLGEIVNTDMPFAGDFTCSDPTITQILKNARWGIRGNYLSIPTDCPQRDERQGWQGDRAAEQVGEAYLFDNRLLYEKWMGDIRDSQRDDGNLSDVCPNYWPFYQSNVTWPACFVIVPGNIYRQTGDMRVIERNYPYMARWIDHLRTFVQDGIIAKDNYGDWCVPPESEELIHSREPWRTTPKDVLATTYYYHVLTRMAEYARLQELNDDVHRYQQEALHIKNAFNQKLYNEEQGYYGNGSQTSQILPLRFGMVPKEREDGLVDYIVNHIETKTGGAIGTGLIGGQWLMRSLSDHGSIDLAYRFATRREYPSWGYMIDQGATTIWELWNGNTANPAMNSGNHVMLLGDLIIWMFEYLGGIQPDPAQPGFKHIIMHPRIVGDLTFVQAEYDSPYGTIESHWMIDGGSFKWRIRVPVNASATIHLPVGHMEDATESGSSIVEASGVVFLRMDQDRAVLELQSGRYEFESAHYASPPIQRDAGESR